MKIYQQGAVDVHLEIPSLDQGVLKFLQQFGQVYTGTVKPHMFVDRFLELKSQTIKRLINNDFDDNIDRLLSVCHRAIESPDWSWPWLASSYKNSLTNDTSDDYLIATALTKTMPWNQMQALMLVDDNFSIDRFLNDSKLLTNEQDIRDFLNNNYNISEIYLNLYFEKNSTPRLNLHKIDHTQESLETYLPNFKSWKNKHGVRPKLTVYTAWPELIIDSQNAWNVQLHPAPNNILRMFQQGSSMSYSLVKLHDTPDWYIGDVDGHVLVVKEPRVIDVSELLFWMDGEHNAYIDVADQLAVYIRNHNKQYQTKTIGTSQCVYEPCPGKRQTIEQTIQTNTDIKSTTPTWWLQPRKIGHTHDVSTFINNRLRKRKLGVIFIDCWSINFEIAHPDAPNFNFYQHMIDHLSQFNIDSYVFATSFVSLEYITPDVVNYIKTFVSNNSNTLLPQQQKALNDLMLDSGGEKLAMELQSLYTDPRALYIPTMSGLIDWSQKSGINDWLVVGMHWGVCTHLKELGFANLLSYKKTNPDFFNIYSLPECTLRWTDPVPHRRARLCNKRDYDKDYLNWHWENGIAELLLE